MLQWHMPGVVMNSDLCKMCRNVTELTESSIECCAAANNDDDDDQSKPLSVTDDDIDSDQDDLRSFIICN